MGHRVELGEIEACACGLDGVESACCLFDKESSRLTLYYMGTAAEAELRAYLRRELPRYMIPSALHRMDALPMLPNGKIDRKALSENG